MGHVDTALTLAADIGTHESFLAKISSIAQLKIQPLVQAIDEDGL